MLKEFFVRRVSPNSDVLHLLQNLFTFAEKHGINSDGFGHQKGVVGNVVPLPDEYRPLVETFPGTYFLVAYEDRRDGYYKEGTRHQLIRLSTVEHRAATDARTREIDLKLVSGHRADRIEIRAREAVLDQAFEGINQATGEDIERPHGDARSTYEVDEDGNKFPKKLEFSRLDEGLFTFGDTAKPVRWVRSLVVDKLEGKPYEIVYRDLYIIGRHSAGVRDQRADVKTTVLGDLDSPQSILVEFGFGSRDTGRALFEDKEKKVKCIFHTPMAGENPLDVLKDDPVYAELLKESPNLERFMGLLKTKCTMLQEEWDKPQSVHHDNKGRMEEAKQITSE